MGMHYSHFLLAAELNLAPEASHVAAFLTRLAGLNALPVNPAIQLRKHTGKSITGRNGYTGEPLVVPIRTGLPIANLEAIQDALSSEPDYDLVLTGDGPEPLRPFPIYEAGKVSQGAGPYYLQLSCSLRPTTSPRPGLDPLDPNPADPGFHRLGRSRLFSPIHTRPRFWITLELGKGMDPQAHGEVLIGPIIVRAATTHFATTFTEGWTLS